MNRNKCFALGAMLVLIVGAYAPETAAKVEEIKECQIITESGSYVLVNNLTATGEDCLVVDADFVTIDLNGFTMTGDRTGIGILGFKGITVRNGTITNFRRGIEIEEKAHVEGVRADSNKEHGIRVGSSSIVTGNIARNNGTWGIIAAGIVNGNTANFNGGGINVGAFSKVRNNTASNNDSDGIITAMGAIVIGNNASANGMDPAAIGGRGIVVGVGSTVLQNTARNNGGLGLFCSPTGGTPAGFANNVLTGSNRNDPPANFNPNGPQEVNCIPIGTNLCGTDTYCP